MRKRLNISVVILFLALVAVYVNTNNVPNQQIVLQLSSYESSTQGKDVVIERLKAALHSNGAQSITITKLQQDRLKITYFSAAGIYEMQKALTHEQGLSFTTAEKLPDSELPTQSSDCNYVLQISELKQDNSAYWDFEATEIMSFYPKGDRFNTLKNNCSGRLSSIQQLLQSHQNLNELFKTLGYRKQILNHTFPEVRAGPFPVS